MENVQYAEELLREFLVFRGFTNTLQAYETELSTDIGRGFQVDKILDLVFSIYIPKYQADKLVGLLNFLKKCLFSTSEAVLIPTLLKLEVSILRYYIVHAIQSGKKDKVVELFDAYGNNLLQKPEDWSPWFAIPYIKNPSLDPQFRVYFSKEWSDSLLLSFRNFLSEIFSDTRIPALLKISTERNTVKRLKNDIKQLNYKLSQLQALLETKETEILQLRCMASSAPATSSCQKSNYASDDGFNFSIDASSGSVAKDDGNNLADKDLHETGGAVSSHLGLGISDSDGGLALSSAKVSDESSSNVGAISSSPRKLRQSHVDAKGVSLISQIQQQNIFCLLKACPFISWSVNSRTHHLDHRMVKIIDPLFSAESRRETPRGEDLPEVKVDFQETFLGHTSPISRCRFSASGTNIASASVDGTVRIWTYDSSTPTSRNATIYCGSEIMSLDWECRSDRLLLIGTADGGIKAWNVDAKRVVCDLSTTAEFPSVLDLKCSPVEPIFVSAAASKRQGLSKIESLGFASLTVWNMKMWKATTVLPLGEDPPAITSLCFNHNGKILAASATDGMIHMFDMSAGLQITGWPAHDSAISSVLFGPDETSIFSLGSDGKIFEWSLQNQGQVLWSRDCSRFCYPESTEICRHEAALDFSGKRLLMTSGLVRSPIYQVRGQASAHRTLPHTAAITTVDWHPTLPIFLTGSADHSVRVTSIGS